MRRTSFATAFVTLRVGVVAGVLAVIGCDDRHGTVLLENKPATQPARPTTQELLAGRQDRIPLKVIPFTVSAPAGWQMKSQGGVMILEGPTPSGVVQIQIGRHASPIAQHADRLIDGAKKEAAAHPGPLTRADVRELSGMKVLETRSIGTTRSVPTIDATGKVIAPTSTSVSWKISAFVPVGSTNDVCELHFVDLTREQYDLDQQLLERIIASLEYDSKAESN